MVGDCVSILVLLDCSFVSGYFNSSFSSLSCNVSATAASGFASSDSVFERVPSSLLCRFSSTFVWMLSLSSGGRFSVSLCVCSDCSVASSSLSSVSFSSAGVWFLSVSLSLSTASLASVSWSVPAALSALSSEVFLS